MSDLLAPIAQKIDGVTGLAIIFAALVWAGVTIWERPAPPPRYSVIYGGVPGLTYRLDGRTGAMWMCKGMQCQAMPWADVPDNLDFGGGPGNSVH